MTLELDNYFTLQGDEETDVGLHCRRCDRGGRPLIFLTYDKAQHPYPNTDVILVHTISDLFAPATKHIAWHRARSSRGL